MKPTQNKKKVNIQVSNTHFLSSSYDSFMKKSCSSNTLKFSDGVVESQGTYSSFMSLEKAPMIPRLSQFTGPELVWSSQTSKLTKVLPLMLQM